MVDKQKECPSCALDVPADADVCPFCAYEFPVQRTSVKYAAVAMVVLLVIWMVGC
jgi:hypothetical protein